jgi:alkanesulfonate monooxygenase SsuD/methylene tetrahydromethanopterin reductase-like flavin-dependent oxidoreductase (luciferase family)
VKFSDFLFPESRDPADDRQVIDESLRQAQLADRLGVDVVWLAEHHFDGNCAYVDPVTFAAALAPTTDRIRIGFAVAQTSLHHPIRLAEQLALLDNLSRGRLIVGLGRGTAHNIYEYQGYGIDHAESQARFEEAEQILFKAWTHQPFEHHGRFWDLKVPVLRPLCYTRPHPYVIRSASTEAGMLEIARQGQPFLMNVQNNEVTRHRMTLYRQTQREMGLDERSIAANVAACWVWRNVFVADTDEEARRIGIPAFQAMQEHRAAMRNRVRAEQGITISHGAGARAVAEQALICGAPSTVADAMAELDRIGVGGVIISFRMGPMPYEVAANSLSLFMQHVAPQFRTTREAA